MKTAIQQCAQDLFETDLSHDVKTKIVDILHTHLTTEKEQLKTAFNDGASWELYGSNITQDERAKKYYQEIFGYSDEADA